MIQESFKRLENDPYDQISWLAVTCGFLSFEKGETCQLILIMLRGKVALS